MTDGHPLVWAVALAAALHLAVHGGQLACGVVAAALMAIGLAAGGPRRAAFTVAIGTVICLVVACAAYALLLLPDPTYAWLRAAQAACAVLTLGLAGQLVSARSWLAFNRATLGGLAPAAGWLACAGETATGALAHPRRWLSTWVNDSALLAATVPSPGRAPAWSDAVRSCLGLSLLGLPLATLVTDLTGTTLLLIAVAALGLIGLALPGAAPSLRRPQLPDLVHGVIAGALVVTAHVA